MKIKSLDKILTNSIISWIPLSIAIILFSGLSYLLVQQAIRISANYPQSQMSEDIAKQLDEGRLAKDVIPSNQIDISQSLSPYVIIYDDSEKPLASSATLHSKIPTLPSGVLYNVRKNNSEWFTWQPEDGVRSAVVVTRYSTNTTSGFVLAGRSLRDIENLETLILHDAVLFCLFTLLVTLLSQISLEFFKAKN